MHQIPNEMNQKDRHHFMQYSYFWPHIFDITKLYMILVVHYSYVCMHFTQTRF